MEFKFPKTLHIDDVVWTMNYNKDSDGGSFHYSDCILEIGIKSYKTQPLRMFSVLIHELKEIIQTQQNTRYERGDENGNYEFHYSHKEHTDLCWRLAGLLSKFIK